MSFWIIVYKAAIIGFGNIVSLGNRQEVDKYLPGLWIDVANTVEKPIELLFASHEYTAKDDPKTSLRMTLGVHKRECCPQEPPNTNHISMPRSARSASISFTRWSVVLSVMLA